MKFLLDRKALSLESKQYRRHVSNILTTLLHDDVGEKGDITTQSIGIDRQSIVAHIVAKESGVLAGMEEVCFFLNDHQDNEKALQFSSLKHDGELLRKMDTIMVLRGSAGTILKLERTILNVFQRMSGIATSTASYVQKVRGKALILPTRKTPWGQLDKKSCLVGGGGTHRLSLSDALLLKDTHLKILHEDFSRIFQRLEDYLANHRPKFVEVEVETNRQLLQVLKARSTLQTTVPFVVMFDNMKPTKIQKLLRTLEPRHRNMEIFFEASGNITLDNVTSYANTGVHFLSIGSLTHSSRALNFSLKVI